MQSRELAPRELEKLVSWWVGLRKRTEGRNWQERESEVNQRCIGMMRLKGSETVLGVGIGTGSLEVDLIRKYPEIDLWGLDVNIESLETAGDWSRFRLAPTLLHGDGRHLHFPDGEFDLVYARNVLKHEPGWPELVTEMMRVAKKDGGQLRIMETIALNEEHRVFLDKVAAIAGERQGGFMVVDDLVQEIEELAGTMNVFGVSLAFSASSFVGIHYLASQGLDRFSREAKEIFRLYRDETPQVLLDDESVRFVPSKENIWEVESDQFWLFWIGTRGEVK